MILIKGLSIFLQHGRSSYISGGAFWRRSSRFKWNHSLTCCSFSDRITNYFFRRFRSFDLFHFRHFYFRHSSFRPYLFRHYFFRHFSFSTFLFSTLWCGTELPTLEDSKDVVPAPLDVRPPAPFPEASSPDLTITIPNSPRKSKHHRRHQNRKRNLRIKNEIRVGLGFRPAPYRVPSHLKSHFSTGSES